MTFVLTTAPGRLTGATMDDSATSCHLQFARSPHRFSCLCAAQCRLLVFPLCASISASVSSFFLSASAFFFAAGAFLVNGAVLQNALFVNGAVTQKRAAAYFDPSTGGGSMFIDAGNGLGEPLNVSPSYA